MKFEPMFTSSIVHVGLVRIQQLIHQSRLRFTIQDLDHRPMEPKSEIQWARKIYNLASMATGLGITANIIDCYAALIRLYRDGDRVFLVGIQPRSLHDPLIGGCDVLLRYSPTTSR